MENVKFLSSKLENGGKLKGNLIKKIEIFKETDLKKEILSFKKETSINFLYLSIIKYIIFLIKI